MIKQFTIFGERCSGTNYLEQIMLENFDINITWNYGWKHFFGFYDFKQTEEENETLFIGIVRHPIYWIDSFFKEQHHLQNRLKPLDKYLFDEIISVNEKNEIMKEDFNYLTGKPYKNIFELRFMKNYYLINKMPKNVKNYILISYENLRDNFKETASLIHNKFGLKNKYSFYRKPTYFKDEKKIKYVKKEIKLPLKYQYICAKKLNIIQELKLGYDIRI